MATQLFYADALSSLTISGAVVRTLSTTRGAGVITKNQGSVNINTNVFDTGTTILYFAMQVNAYSATTGNYTFNHWGKESNAMANNFAGATSTNVYDSGGTFRFGICNGWTHGSEYTTSMAAYNFVQAGTARTINDGDYIVVGPAHNHIGAGATGFTDSFSYAGTTAAADGDSYCTFPDTITEFVTAATSFLIPHRRRGLIVR